MASRKRFHEALQAKKRYKMEGGEYVDKHHNSYYPPSENTGDIKELTERVAENRVYFFVQFLRVWQDEKGNFPTAVLKGGGSMAQASRDGVNPKVDGSSSQQGHYIQTKILNVPFADLPDQIKNLVGFTQDVPVVHNQSFHRSFDEAQEEAIKKYNAGGNIDANFVREYVKDVIERIENDESKERFQYKGCDKDHIKYTLNILETIRDNKNLDVDSCNFLK